MLISFITVIPNTSEEFKESIESVIKQNNYEDYELIVILDKLNHETNMDEYFINLFKKYNNIKLIFNNDRHGSSYSWNLGLDICSGKYVKFISQGDTIDNDFIKSIKKYIEENKNNIDIIEYSFLLKSDKDIQSKSYLEPNKVYNLKEDYKPFAYTNNLLFNKLFKLEIIKNFNFNFRNQVRFDMLFIYKLLSQSKTYLYLNSKNYENIILRPVQYSIFDIVNQWTHIFNYYRRIKKYNEISDYLKYSYYKTILHIWIWTISKTDNKLLIKKALEFANRKYENKKSDFIKNNKVFLESEDLTFKTLAENFSSYYKDKLKNIK
ncbi:glycosyltransferase family 2 protein [Spiroplasma turonicum]|uniref:Glycosyltransferase n=1 Tax=Spiroplasma turonicum TaxID=216946 RepID=A0A0K1P5Z0_9MOLU|nr:glycosyltransferase family 2 protein [Spiroplasma turonicum]AKU79337.1 glycosyltransferase [Spiroplasma turonicum]ALX70358.1 glycosyltransferase [Spiroplasma turonicum]